MASPDGGTIDKSSATGANPDRWKADLELEFVAAAARTSLLRRRQFGPLAVQRPFYPEADGTCHVYILHPPAGIAGGDELRLSFSVGKAARCVLTTPGASKFYRSALPGGVQRNLVEVGPGAVCELLPQETIIFDGAHAEIDTCVTLAGDATYVGWDIICLGRPAANERFNRGMLSQRINIERMGSKIWFERFGLRGGSPLLDAAFAFGGHPVFGTMVYAGALQDGLSDLIRNAVCANTNSRFSVSQLEQVLVCRYLGAQAEEARHYFFQAWSVLRSCLHSKPACAPRIWST